MNAFVNGAISALNRCLNLILILDPDGKDENLVQMRFQINLYIEMYKSLLKEREENPIIDETWERIKETCDSLEKEFKDKKFDA